MPAATSSSKSSTSSGRKRPRTAVTGSNSAKPKAAAGSSNVAGPVHDMVWITQQWEMMGMRGPPSTKISSNPKSILANYLAALGDKPQYKAKTVTVDGRKMTRVSVVGDPDPPPPAQAFGAPSLPQASEPVVGSGDAINVKEAEKFAALHACIQLAARKLFNSSMLPTRNVVKPIAVADTAASSSTNVTPGAMDPPLVANKSVALSNGQKFGFGKPDLRYNHVAEARSRGGRSRKASSNGSGTWQAILLVAKSQVGLGEAKSKKDAANKAYLDAGAYIERCDPALWNDWCERKQGNLIAKGQIQAHVKFYVDPRTDEQLRETVFECQQSLLFKRAEDMMERERVKAQQARLRRSNGADPSEDSQSIKAESAHLSERERQRLADVRGRQLESKNQELLERLRRYQIDERMDRMRTQRASLPITSNASSVLAKIATSPVVVVLAATGSGKTTQIPQLILDDAIMAGKGAECNIVCTQPRRIAAISVAERVAKERGESLGESIGYQVRFESKPPTQNGSVLFCTTGLFLRRMQTDLNKTSNEVGFLDSVTHVCVDEVHERDVDTDLLLFVLRMLLHKRRKEGKSEIKVVLMSATIDPKLFCEYFADPDTRRLAPTVDVPGRAFPVEKFWLDETVRELRNLRLGQHEGGWVWQEKSVVEYLQRELVPRIDIDPRTGKPVGEVDDLDMPIPLLALIIANTIAKSDEGHVLVFLPGWDEIQAVKTVLSEPRRFPLLGLDFTEARNFEIHVLHSTIPIADQQAVFEPPPNGIRRIVLSTNIAETSVTIPDVVYVVDSAKCKEKRYDPERRLSQLVSAWTGTSNVLQRAGRAGRHRPGEYYGIVSKARFEVMEIHQTVEMLRTDLANTLMHVIGLQLPGLSVADVLSSTIQPPERARIQAAKESLIMVGAVDYNERLTSLGRVLLQLPVEVAVGKLCLYGSFFRCLDQTLTLAAILTNRDPFLSPPLLKAEADRIKNSWTPIEFRSDPFAVLSAFSKWWNLQGAGNYSAANAFAHENFLSKPTLLLIQKIKEHILQSLDKAGALSISAGGEAVTGVPGSTFRRGRNISNVIPESLNVNGHSLPLLSALVATALAPNFAIRVSEKSLRTQQDKSCTIHPSSVNSRKNEKAADLPVVSNKQLYAYGEKSKTGGLGDKGGGQIFLRFTTMLDPLGYMLFGASSLRIIDQGVEADSWLPLIGDGDVLDDVERLKQILDWSLLRVFEGLEVAVAKGRQHTRNRRHAPSRPSRAPINDEEDSEREDDVRPVDPNDPVLADREIQDLDTLTSNVVRILNYYADARGAGSTAPSRLPSRGPSRAPSPQGYRSQHQTMTSLSSSRAAPSSVPVTRAATPRAESPVTMTRPGSTPGFKRNNGSNPNSLDSGSHSRSTNRGANRGLNVKGAALAAAQSVQDHAQRR
ncbi:hypothetical protein OIO90_004112 [Microbotryomycetes sp. JL221]|nr:hypothetical protein OIO90_004112 [Microbotryomycetes sp. JL221]